MPAQQMGKGRWPRWAIVAMVLLAAVGCGSLKPGGADKVALVIGNANYTMVAPLRNPTNDAQDTCAALARLKFKVMCLSDVATRAEFESQVQAFTDEIGPGTAALFYYSGHGVQSGGENYLVPTGAGVGSSDNPVGQLYKLSDLFTRLKTKPSAFQMIVLDACRSDPFAPPTDASSKAVASRAAFSKSLEVVGRASYGTAVINDAPVGTIVLYATASKDTAYDGEGRNGPLTRHFLLNVEKRGLNVEDLMKNVISGVQDETKRLFGKEQTPFTYQSFRNRFCFAGCFNPDNFQVPPTN